MVKLLPKKKQQREGPKRKTELFEPRNTRNAPVERPVEMFDLMSPDLRCLITAARSL